MWELDCEESWALKNWCFWTVVLEKTLESPLDCKEIQPVHPKGNRSWIFIGSTDAEAETPIFWPPDVKNWLIWKDPDAGKDWRQEEKGVTEDEIVGWHHWWTGVWISSGSWWWTGKPGVLQSIGSQRVWDDWATELSWTEGILRDSRSSSGSSFTTPKTKEMMEEKLAGVSRKQELHRQGHCSLSNNQGTSCAIQPGK